MTLAGRQGAGRAGGAVVTQHGDPPPGTWLLRRGRDGRFSVLVPRRAAIAGLCVLAACLILGFLSLGWGAASFGYGDVIDVLAGRGRKFAELVVMQWRMPRIVLAIAVGAALGCAGAIFQAVTRNPLGSPDLIGFTMGAQTGILFAVLIAGTSLAATSAAALIGGLLAGAVIYALSSRGGFGGLRLILAGIAVSAMLGSLNRWMLVHAPVDDAHGAQRAITGSLTGADWATAMPVSVLIIAALIAVAARSRDLRGLDLGPDLATTLGLRVGAARAVLILLGIILVALATTAAGPITFVALIAPHIARGITRSATTPLPVAAGVGALLLLAADVAGTALLDGLPVGLVTASLGGVYFMALLITEARRTP
ncbi:FecCD family ABC transporter permease [Corynebacterium sp. NPDC060344]|uniref:FecCD family ABC transporter permease n=1 Tax=Corynebacterium sp. NPDC060344 TaxID=3347101 RepID=UPI0036668E95